MTNIIAIVVTILNALNFGFALSNEQCSSQLDVSSLFSFASSIADSAAKILVPSKFARVSKGLAG